MHDLVVLRNRIIPASKAEIPAITNLNLYGKGIFSTIAIYNGEPFLFQKHWSRLRNNAEKVGLDLSEFDERELLELLVGLVEANKVSIGKCRITFFDESVGRVWNGADTDLKVGLLIQSTDLAPQRQHISINRSPFPINSQSPLSGVKSCNYLENLLAAESAQADGFDEAIRINERGIATSACMANVFWTKDGELFTPGLKTGCLAGTTREFILGTREVKEVEVGIDVLLSADHLFLTSAGIGITQIGRFGEKEFSRKLHALTQVIESIT